MDVTGRGSSGRHRRIAARACAQRRIAEITEKYFSRAVGANVTFGRGPNNDFTCDIVAPVAQGVVLKASHRAPRGADGVQRRRRPHRKAAAPLRQAADASIRSTSDQPLCRECRLHDLRRRQRQRATRRRPVPGDRRRDPRRHPALERVRRGHADGPAQHQRADVQEQRDRRSINMIYRREDGNIGWVEPQPTEPLFSIAAACDARRHSGVRTMQLADFLDFDAIKPGLSGRQQALAAAATGQSRRPAARPRSGGDPRQPRRARTARLDRIWPGRRHPPRQDRRA